MISRLVYVNCDDCGHPAEPVPGTAQDARRAAAAEGFIRRGRRDICPDCRGVSCPTCGAAASWALDLGEFVCKGPDAHMFELPEGGEA